MSLHLIYCYVLVFLGLDRDGGMWTLAKLVSNSVKEGKGSSDILKLNAGEVREEEEEEEEKDDRPRRRRRRRRSTARFSKSIS